mgnify:CR=1 FL=1
MRMRGLPSSSRTAPISASRRNGRISASSGSATGPGTPISTESLTGITHYDPAALTIIARAGNAVEASHDATSHAELRAMRAAALSVKNWRLQDATLYCTLEPCVVCLGAAYAFRVPRVVFGAPDHRMGAAGSWLSLHTETHPFHALNIRGGVCAEESSKLLKDFFRERRKGPPRM